ncbi:menaquinone-dependent protoporphyrinogen IX dehydrogenase [Haloarculaceae archaeon H-GB2-1]|nr:menaquinone-dependent protoporphyrinogen IX dehydrogenase [Haloarculaceae archaeon H-GB1-1]MEA5387185.1 menaquinone-dependent protoporphyrinogen IX dehydrogenase [Haloarculaceae archaeon H-GB11]MEA5408678.1 menaquinone-dependent protoporphyrinogen IX dehydrogenase [Haloarculaceae archaeon H-GB2-1]
MATILLVYESSEGQTAKVASFVASELRDRDHRVDVERASDLPSTLDVERYDGVLIGASVHAGEHQTPVRRFVTANRDTLSSAPSGFFSVSLSAASEDEQSREAAAEIAEDFLADVEWEPDQVALVPGALKYSKYGFFKRLLLREIARRESGDTDTSQDYEYTDWDSVAEFADDFARLVEEATPMAPDSGDAASSE